MRTRHAVDEIVALLDLFEEKVPDRETNRFVRNLCEDHKKWIESKDYFSSTVRPRNRQAGEEQDFCKRKQYCFEENVLKTLYNLTMPRAPFDAVSPYFVIKDALLLAAQLEISIDRVVKIVTIREE